MKSTPLNVAILVAVALSSLQSADASCGLCLHSSEDCPYTYDGFTGRFCGMFKDSMGLTTDCCCPNTMECAATSTKCDCTSKTTAPAPAPAPAPATPSSESTGGDKSSGNNTVLTAILSSVGAAVAGGLVRMAFKKSQSNKEQQQQQQQEKQQGSKRPAAAKVSAQPSGGQNGDENQVDLATTAAVKLANIVVEALDDEE
ncbi:hypothetical protein PINS_up006037 [Pythium insidiosum]|nr:hypothetical protein PINS_up006037 [Pythium insidiosum]